MTSRMIRFSFGVIMMRSSSRVLIEIHLMSTNNTIRKRESESVSTCAVDDEKGISCEEAPKDVEKNADSLPEQLLAAELSDIKNRNLENTRSDDEEEEEKCEIEPEPEPFMECNDMITTNESSPSETAPPSSNAAIRSRSQPGAFRVDGIDGSDIPGSPSAYDSAALSNVTPSTPSTNEQVVEAWTVHLENDRDVEAQAQQRLTELLQDSSIVGAQLVDTERFQELEALNKRLRQIKRIVSLCNPCDPKFRRQQLGLGFIVMLLVAFTLGIVLTRDDYDGPPFPTPAPTPEPTSVEQGSLSEFLAELASFDHGAALYNQLSPQYKAAKWLANDNTNIDMYSDKKKIQRYVLATLFFSTNGDSWTENASWLDDEDECGRWWQAGGNNLSCTSEGAVNTLILRSNSLEGSFPPEIGLLSNSLELIQLDDNDISGTMPSELAYLAQLRRLNVDNNSLRGTFATELGALTRLAFLGMAGNDLTGTIPTELFLLTNLFTLRLGTSLTGTIPAGIGDLNSLTDLRLYDNMLTGELPSEIGLLTKLTYLFLWSNQLSSAIPSTIGLMTALEYLHLGDNEVVGTIHTMLGLLTSLEELRLDGNRLTGPIPTELALLSTNIDLLELGENFLSSSIPSELVILTGLTALGLHGNSLSGHIPEEIGSLTNLVHLSLHTNDLTGIIPSGILDLTNLQTLQLHDNNLTGPFTCPADIFECTVSCDGDDETCRVLPN